MTSSAWNKAKKSALKMGTSPNTAKALGREAAAEIARKWCWSFDWRSKRCWLNPDKVLCAPVLGRKKLGGKEESVLDIRSHKLENIGKNVSNLCLKECESILDSFLKVRYWTCISIKYKRLSFSKGASKELFSQSFFCTGSPQCFLKSYSQMFFRVIPTDLFHR